jgi:hypothetical protein
MVYSIYLELVSETIKKSGKIYQSSLIKFPFFCASANNVRLPAQIYQSLLREYLFLCYNLIFKSFFILKNIKLMVFLNDFNILI